MSDRPDPTAFLGLPKLDQPCGRCGWQYKGFHICFDASTPEPGTRAQPAKSPGGTTRVKSETKPANRTAWNKGTRRDTSKDPGIVQAYKDGVGMRAIATQYSCSYVTVRKVITEEEKRTGESLMRKPGTASPSKLDSRSEGIKERSQKVVELYKSGLDRYAVGEKLGIHHTTVANDIHRVEAETGEKIMRPAHANLRWKREEDEDGLAS